MDSTGEGNMPRLPWMLNFVKEDHKPVPDMQLKAINAPTHLEYLCNLNVSSQVGKRKLTTLACTLNSTHNNLDFLINLIKHEMRIACIDASYGTEEERCQLLTTLRTAVKSCSDDMGLIIPLAIALEMTSFRIRTGRLQDRTVSKIKLKDNEEIFVTVDDNYKCYCNNTYIYVDHYEIVNLLTPGDLIYINYGDIILEVIEKGKHKKVKCLVKSGGKLFDHSIVHLPNIPTEITENINEDFLNFGLKEEVDVIIISNVQSASLIINTRIKLGDAGKKMLMFARIENMLGVQNIDEILCEADGIVIARGELGIGLPPEKLFIAQKSLCAKANKLGKPVVISTHILSSMNKDRLPARSEMLDVSNAILDGSDCLQLTEEVMLGSGPLKCITMLTKMCKEAEAAIYQLQLFNNLSQMCLTPKDPTNTIAISAVDFALRNNAACIIVLTTSGRSAKLIAKYKPRCPILAITRYGHIARKLNMWKAIIPIYYIAQAKADFEDDMNTRIQYAITFGKFSNFICLGDVIVLVTGWKRGVGFTNTLRIIYAS